VGKKRSNGRRSKFLLFSETRAEREIKATQTQQETHSRYVYLANYCKQANEICFVLCHLRLNPPQVESRYMGARERQLTRRREGARPPHAPADCISVLVLVDGKH
jgi:hypothetical protein